MRVPSEYVGRQSIWELVETDGSLDTTRSEVTLKFNLHP